MQGSGTVDQEITVSAHRLVAEVADGTQKSAVIDRAVVSFC
jgi:hypothetical protein